MLLNTIISDGSHDIAYLVHILYHFDAKSLGQILLVSRADFDNRPVCSPHVHHVSSWFQIRDLESTEITLLYLFSINND